jgi:uncharacterized protein YbcI
MDLTQQQPLAGDGHGPATANMLTSVSNEMVAIYKEHFGRGPTLVRSSWAGPDTLLVILEQTLTRAERNLVRLEEHQRLRDIRMLFQYNTVNRFCEPVERLTGRKVRAFISGIDTQVEGVSAEMFLLHPEGYDGPSRIELARR